MARVQEIINIYNFPSPLALIVANYAILDEMERLKILIGKTEPGENVFSSEDVTIKLSFFDGYTLWGTTLFRYNSSDLQWIEYDIKRIIPSSSDIWLASRSCSKSCIENYCQDLLNLLATID